MIVEIYGRCTGNLVVERNNVTLVGMGDHPEISGRIDAEGDPVGSIVVVRHAVGAEIRNLTLSGGLFAVDSLFSVVKLDGVRLESSLAGYRSVSSLNEIRNSIVRDNQWGVANLAGDRTTVRSTRIVGNEIVGLYTRDHATISAIGVELSENGAAFSTLSGSLLNFAGQSSIVPGSRGLALGAQLQFQGGLEAAGLAVQMRQSASGTITVGAFVEADFELASDSSLVVEHSLTGNIAASALSRVVVADGGSATTVGCMTAAEAVCIGTVESSNCPGCMGSSPLSPTQTARLRTAAERPLPPALQRIVGAGEVLFQSVDTDR
ncbi:hypothetical protein N9971_00575 [bacterium]|nr:hypothetical protein [bacterium]